MIIALILLLMSGIAYAEPFAGVIVNEASGECAVGMIGDEHGLFSYGDCRIYSFEDFLMMEPEAAYSYRISIDFDEQKMCAYRGFRNASDTFQFCPERPKFGYYGVAAILGAVIAIGLLILIFLRHKNR